MDAKHCLPFFLKFHASSGTQNVIVFTDREMYSSTGSWDKSHSEFRTEVFLERKEDSEMKEEGQAETRCPLPQKEYQEDLPAAQKGQ